METIERLSAADVSACLKAISDPTRLLMMKLMEDKELCVCQFVEMFETSQPAISQHLKRLKQTGLVKEEKRGQWRFYSIDQTSAYAKLIHEVLNNIEDNDPQLMQLKEKEMPVNCC